LLATTAQPSDLAAAGTSYSHMTMSMGKSLVDDETSRAVDTELGRAYRGRIPANPRGESREDVRKRILTWKANVESRQRATAGLGIVSGQIHISQPGKRAGGRTKEEVLQHDRLLGESAKTARSP
jgi:hypothetical protein